MNEPAPFLSVVVPLFDEEANVAPLAEKVREALADAPLRGWELLLVDDGSRDGSAAEAARIAASDPRVRALRLVRNYGQTTALQAGFDEARGDIVVTMDGDLQNDPADIPTLLAAIAEGNDLVVGYRVRRQDDFLMRKVPSWAANRLIRRWTRVPVRDVGCALKAYRRSLLDRLHLYSEMHRFIPALAVAGGGRVVEVPVRHHPRVAGVSKYGPGRIWRVLADLLTVKMIQSYSDRPLALFGPIAGVTLLISGFAAAAAVLAALEWRPWLASSVVLPGIAILTFGLGVFLVMVGLIAEEFLRTEATTAPRPLPVAHEVGP